MQYLSWDPQVLQALADMQGVRQHSPRHGHHRLQQPGHPDSQAAPEEGQLLFTNPKVTSLQQSRGNAFHALTRAWLQSCRGSEAESQAELLCQPWEVGTCHGVDQTATGLSYLILCHTFIYFSCGSFIKIAQY